MHTLWPNHRHYHHHHHHHFIWKIIQQYAHLHRYNFRRAGQQGPTRTLTAALKTYPFNGPLPETTWVSQYQKGKTDLDFTEARDSEWQWHQLGHMQVCTLLQTENHSSTPPLSFLPAADALPAAQPTASKHWRQPALTAALKRGINLILGTYSITQVKYYKQENYRNQSF